MTFLDRLFQSKRIYLDHASATLIDSRVLNVIHEFQKVHFANASAIHRDGVSVRKAIEGARDDVARSFHAHADEIIFTSGGTESDQLAILGVLAAWRKNNIGTPHIITTNIEHPAIRELCKHLLETKEANVTFIPVQSNGIVDPTEIKKALRPETVLVSVMYANNEIGTIQPIAEIAKTIRHFKKHHSDSDLLTPNSYPVFHTDAAQAINYLSIDVEKLHVDLLSCNGSKIYGPKGIGALYKRRGVPFQSPFPGGGQEFGFRSGTENGGGIIGLSKALSITENIKESESTRLTSLRDYLILELEQIEGVILNGDKNLRLSNNINISISGIPSELLVLELDARGIAVSSKSACQSDDPDESYVLRAINPGLSGENGSIRFSLGRSTTKGDIEQTITEFKKIIQKLRPFYPSK